MIGLHKLRGVNPNAVVVHFSAVATVASLSAFLFFDRRTDGLPVYHPEALALLLGIGLTASLGQMLLTRAFAAGDPAKVSVVGLSQVVFTCRSTSAVAPRGDGHGTRWDVTDRRPDGLGDAGAKATAGASRGRPEGRRGPGGGGGLGDGRFVGAGPPRESCSAPAGRLGKIFLPHSPAPPPAAPAPRE